MAATRTSPHHHCIPAAVLLCTVDGCYTPEATRALEYYITAPLHSSGGTVYCTVCPAQCALHSSDSGDHTGAAGVDHSTTAFQRLYCIWLGRWYACFHAKATCDTRLWPYQVHKVRTLISIAQQWSGPTCVAFQGKAKA